MLDNKNLLTILIIVFDVILRSGIALGFIFVLIKRYKELSNCAAPDYLKRPNQFYVRLVFIIIQITVMGFSVLMSFIGDGYYINQNDMEYFSIMLILPITAYVLQIQVMIREFNLRQPIMWQHKIFWIINLTMIVISFVLIVYNNNYLVDQILIGIALIFQTSQVVYSIFIKQQDYESFLGLGFFENFAPSVTDDLIEKTDKKYEDLKKQNMSFITQQLRSHKCPLVVTVQKNVKIVGHGENTKHYFKIISELKEYGYSKEVVKTQQDIFKFEKALNREFEQNPVLKLQLHEIQMNLESQLGALEHYNVGSMISIIQTYLNVLSGKLDFYTKTYLEFLEIDEEEQKKLFKLQSAKATFLSMNKQDSGMKTFLVSNHITDVITELDETQLENSVTKSSKTSGTAGLESESPGLSGESRSPGIKLLKRGPVKMYGAFIEVQVLDFSRNKDHIIYQIQFRFVDDQHRTWKIEKRFKEIREFHESLKEANPKIKFPYLEKKMLGLDSKELKSRQEEVENYFNIILNEKLYFNNQEILKFTNTNVEKFKQLEVQYKLTSSMTFNSIKDLEVICRGNSVQIIKDKKSHTVYKFSFLGKDGKEVKYFEKRFKQFCKLNKYMELRILNNNKDFTQKLSFPAKFNTFGIKTSVTHRQNELTRYISQLLKVPNIGESYYFRKFFDLPTTGKADSIQINIDNPDDIRDSFSKKTTNGNILNDYQELDDENDETSFNSYKLDALRTRYEKSKSNQNDLEDN